MIIGIYENAGSFSDRWIEYCKQKNIQFISLDIFRSDLIEYIKKNEISVLLAHPAMSQAKSELAAKSILRTCANIGVRVFPNDSEFWHFDDKISQKYIFESLRIPSPKSFVFYDKHQALRFADNAEYPIVFKLRRGAGSINVELVKSKSGLIRLVNKMFGKGVSANKAAVKDISTKLRIHKTKKDWVSVIKRSPKTLANLIRIANEIPNERGYVYLQEFIPGNDCDIRVAVIGSHAFAFKRLVRPGDFRASGSYLINHDQENIDPKFIAAAFEAAEKLGSVSMAFDFVRRPDGSPVIVEFSYGYNPEVIYGCPGYWSQDLTFTPGEFYPQDLIIEYMIGQKDK